MDVVYVYHNLIKSVTSDISGVKMIPNNFTNKELEEMYQKTKIIAVSHLTYYKQAIVFCL